MTDKTKKRIRIALAAVFLCMFCVSAYMIISQLHEEQREKDAFAELAAQVELYREQARQMQEEDDSSSAPEQSGQDGQDGQAEPDESDGQAGQSGQSEQSGNSGTDGDLPAVQRPLKPHEKNRRPEYEPLHEMNPDFFGWIWLDGTEINYPVMHTPSDPEHYLHRAFDGSYSKSGVPFLDAECFEGCGNYLIYGHHMKNGSMFAALMEYVDSDFWEKHPVINFDTLNDAGEYEVLGVFYSEAYPVNAVGVFRYYEYTDLSDPDVFAEYVEQVKNSALYDTGVDAEYGDTLLTLSTCRYYTGAERFVVVARKPAPEETEEAEQTGDAEQPADTEQTGG